MKKENSHVGGDERSLPTTTFFIKHKLGLFLCRSSHVVIENTLSYCGGFVCNKDSPALVCQLFQEMIWPDLALEKQVVLLLRLFVLLQPLSVLIQKTFVNCDQKNGLSPSYLVTCLGSLFPC